MNITTRLNVCGCRHSPLLVFKNASRALVSFSVNAEFGASQIPAVSSTFCETIINATDTAHEMGISMFKVLLRLKWLLSWWPPRGLVYNETALQTDNT